MSSLTQKKEIRGNEKKWERRSNRVEDVKYSEPVLIQNPSPKSKIIWSSDIQRHSMLCHNNCNFLPLYIKYVAAAPQAAVIVMTQNNLQQVSSTADTHPTAMTTQQSSTCSELLDNVSFLLHPWLLTTYNHNVLYCVIDWNHLGSTLIAAGIRSRL